MTCRAAFRTSSPVVRRYSPLTHLHASVSTRSHPVAAPATPFHLDALLADAPLTGGLKPVLGEHHLRVASVRGFPTATSPGMLDDLNRLGFGYR